MMLWRYAPILLGQLGWAVFGEFGFGSLDPGAPQSRFLVIWSSIPPIAPASKFLIQSWVVLCQYAINTWGVDLVQVWQQEVQRATTQHTRWCSLTPAQRALTVTSTYSGFTLGKRRGTPLPQLLLNPGGALSSISHPQGSQGSTVAFALCLELGKQEPNSSIAQRSRFWVWHRRRQHTSDECRCLRCHWNMLSSLNCWPRNGCK
eukprot:58576-Amphidinium_carterae.1